MIGDSHVLQWVPIISSEVSCLWVYMPFYSFRLARVAPSFFFTDESALRLKLSLTLAGTTRRFDLEVGEPPLDSGLIWSTALPSPLCTFPSFTIIARAAFCSARFFLQQVWMYRGQLHGDNLERTCHSLFS